MLGGERSGWGGCVAADVRSGLGAFGMSGGDQTKAAVLFKGPCSKALGCWLCSAAERFHVCFNELCSRLQKSLIVIGNEFIVRDEMCS